ncbi:hypothetical protein FUAX_35590 [Fulvitalea axinellae]|uniref:DUF4412 domain-containing protein n=1 Tax=Fulvitalea axinellae TaxID=1182444 RepID=A0AAU9CSZ8_9BACT|nr:hypothetical protein FUAX_35590 [Fulvitalea axinellae]
MKRIFLPIVALLLASGLGHAQLFKKLKEKAKRIEKKIDDKVNEKVDGAADKLLGNKKSPGFPEGYAGGDMMSGTISVRDGKDEFNLPITPSPKPVAEGSRLAVTGKWRMPGSETVNRFELLLKDPAGKFPAKGYGIPAEANLKLFFVEKNKEVEYASGEVTVFTHNEEFLTFEAHGKTAGGPGLDVKVDLFFHVLTESGMGTGDVYMADERTEEYYDKEDEEENDYEAEMPANYKPGMFGLEVPENLPDEYKFTGEVIFEMRNKRAKPIRYAYLFDKARPDFFAMSFDMSQGDEVGNGFMVFEGEDAINFVKANGMAMCFKVAEGAMSDEQFPDTDFAKDKIKKSGATKNILGYKCVEYRAEMDGERMSLWVAEELKAGKGFFGSGNIHTPYGGLVLEYEGSGRDGNSKMTAVSIDLDKPFTFDTKPYRKRK